MALRLPFRATHPRNTHPLATTPPATAKAQARIAVPNMSLRSPPQPHVSSILVSAFRYVKAYKTMVSACPYTETKYSTEVKTYATVKPETTVVYVTYVTSTLKESPASKTEYKPFTTETCLTKTYETDYYCPTTTYSVTKSYSTSVTDVSYITSKPETDYHTTTVYKPGKSPQASQMTEN